MTVDKARKHVVAEKASWVREMSANIRTLPLSNLEDFLADPKNVAAAESYLRRCLEALFDLGRHLLAKSFAVAVKEYKEIARVLAEKGVLSTEAGAHLRNMAGYRNRMVHLYNEVTPAELFDVCSRHLQEVELVLDALLAWLRNNPDKVDEPL